MLRDYYAHVNTFPDTLLTRFFGLHRVKPHGGRNVRFVVMGNLLCTGHAIHRRYDLKGSTYGRLTPSPYDAGKKILKDLDLDYTYQLDEGYAARLKAQLSADCVLLERLNIMDYSLLLGVHFQTKATRCATRQAAAHPRVYAQRATSHPEMCIRQRVLQLRMRASIPSPEPAHPAALRAQVCRRGRRRRQRGGPRQAGPAGGEAAS